MRVCGMIWGGVVCLLVGPRAMHSKLGWWLLKVGTEVGRALQFDVQVAPRLAWHALPGVEACVLCM